MAQTKTRDEPETMPPDPGAGRMDGLRVRTWVWIGIAIAVVVLGFGAFWTYAVDRDTGMASGMDRGTNMADAGDAVIPPVHGFYEGDDILFVHTEVSDPKVARLLTDMMDSPVPVVAELADVPESLLANVYVFTNGVQPEEARGPMGFQADVFDSAPGDDDYSPLRALNLVTWADDAEPRLLNSAADVEVAEQNGEIAVERPGVVVNMPFVTWPGGRR